MFAVAVIVTLVPESLQLEPRISTEPLRPEPTVRSYCMLQFHEIVEFTLLVNNGKAVPAPDAGALPVPVHPEHTACVPTPSGTGEAAMEAATGVPWAYQVTPVAGVGAP